ncbi:MAG: DUF389 domain-containing protein, partial [Eudoraea sp.]|nr:hypothetical protein [Eudoraea sp.]NNJ40913.1 DUF389 domain-containing protein [Eudoraea sp.]
CTVGFGLAIGNLSYAGGAMYLFIINTIFIGLATFLVIKILRFPMVRYANSRKRRFIGRIASLVALLVMVPAVYTFYKVFQKSNFEHQARQLIDETIEVYEFKEGGRYMEDLTEIDWENSYIELVCMGDEFIPENVINSWRNQKSKYPMLEEAQLRVIQGGRDDSEEKFRYVNELYEAKKAELLNKDERIRILEAELANLSRQATQQIPFTDISAEARASYEYLDGLSFYYSIRTDFSKTDTIPIFEVKWKDEASSNQIARDSRKLHEWLKLRLKNDAIQLKSFTY